ncbi:hypothetical protein A1O1_00441 [Capronia coronata CBS 617.96]|uniref:F-box domain-containing protein n=1 Tax=Capronia coronata CBS 617.96 TaxID=1182541 RepID=W9Z165_9EURO|nr:uncharacterized protein A1O1_00441 [Capronia coronata CBS 617.96]EXJ95321.1 hypothetical protein A1O1_00441 [Capronia coronata CBS 617.96]
MDSGAESQEWAQRPKNNESQTLLAKHLKEKKSEWDAITAQKEPLRLLDLPVDILQAILRELTHTNDLTSLALTHSALHALVIPHIYSRFDIVWPDVNATFENRMGVDALTYGLATLVMAQDVFGEAPYQQESPHPCSHCGHYTQPPLQPTNRPRKIRRGNYFARYTRKFSLGNGPADWVQEYLITKEGGKMLGTLVALAVGRMRNLEAFIWDMPTGVLRDVWLALASLGNRDDGQECRLDRVWVRWHDNQDQGPLASPPPPGTGPGLQASNLPSILAGSAHSLFQIPPYPRVEFPTFSILPPLRSLSVLDIDELPYAEEMSVLIERSLGKLQELRVGMASHAQFDIWARPAEDRAPVLPPLMNGLGDQSPRPGGILGILVHRFCNAFSHHHQSGPSSILDPQKTVFDRYAGADKDADQGKEDELEAPVNPSDINHLGVLLSAHNIQDDDPETISIAPTKRNLPYSQPQVLNAHHGHTGGYLFQSCGKAGGAERKLELETLEIERVYLSITVLSNAIDWSRLTTLTLLGCRNHEQLWRALRKRFTPTSRRRASSAAFRGSSNGAGAPDSGPSATPAFSDYVLNLKRLHTDTVSPSLISFIKDTLAPDSLEWLFLQENSTYKSPVTVDMIYKGAIRRHRSSLTKLLVDSTWRTEDPDASDINWRRWVVNRELITCITSGKMKLRELSMSIDYKDWHYFLRRLPNATTLRSLHIPHIAEHVQGTVHSREAALQVLDIVALRPELELCYLGVQTQCFEILEFANTRKVSGVAPPSGSNAVFYPGELEDIETDQDVGPTGGGGGGLTHPNHHHLNHNHNHNHTHLPHSHAQHAHHAVHEDGRGDDEDDDSSDFEGVSDTGDDGSDEEVERGDDSNAPKRTWRLREILFYDDKISIFKARHGRL